MNNSFEVSSSIKMPEKNTKAVKSKYPFPTMEVGDSVFFSGKTTIDKECIYAYNYARKSDKKFQAMSVEGGVRIWRTE